MAPHATHEKRGMVTIPLHPYGEWRRDLLGDRLHAHVHTTTGLALERYLAFGCGKNCMIFTNAYIVTRMKFRQLKDSNKLVIRISYCSNE